MGRLRGVWGQLREVWGARVHKLWRHMQQRPELFIIHYSAVESNAACFLSSQWYIVVSSVSERGFRSCGFVWVPFGGLHRLHDLQYARRYNS